MTTLRRILDLDKLAAHRRAEADKGYPLLRGCPNTFAVGMLRYLDALSPDDTTTLLSEFEAHERANAAAYIAGSAAPDYAGFPALQAFYSARMKHLSERRLTTFPVKTVAGVLNDPNVDGSLERWAALLHLPPEAAALDTPHATRAEDLVPVPPRKLRSTMAHVLKMRFGAEAERLSSESTRFTCALGECQVAVDVAFVSAQGWRRQHQFNYVVWLKPRGEMRFMLGGYESIWSLHPEWDFVTEENAERSIEHLCDSVCAMVGLLPDGRSGTA